MIILSIALMFALNFLMWGMLLYDQRRLHRKYKREQEIKMQRISRLFTTTFIRLEELERDDKSRKAQ